MPRPMGPKRLAAIEQMAALRAKGVPDLEIREKLVESGLTRAQAKELIPINMADMEPAPMRSITADAEMRAANIEGAIHFLETVAKRINPTIIDRFNDLGSLRHDSLSWARKLRGVL